MQKSWKKYSKNDLKSNKFYIWTVIYSYIIPTYFTYFIVCKNVFIREDHKFAV